ncbi:MAG: hypothetical protein Unbinned2716contig1000_7 [Prokaryotic dsDNA virus sp.]|nr:MAG: hypothetical protein Unbinned2716contig1000_7 [Prokaryotic dsDNA virus sp.]|tara:strand:+ start:34278 stop:35270 length:993 start_codon:yes stop_codon:yes gene_type:complete
MANLITHSLNYSKEDAQKYFMQPLFVGNSALDYFEIMTGVKSSQKLDKFSTLQKITKANVTGFAGATGVSYTQRSITVARMEAEVAQAGGAFWNSIKGELLRTGNNKDDISGTKLQKIVADIMMRGVMRDLERQLWFSDTASASADYNVYDGILKQLTSLPAAQRLGCLSVLTTDTARDKFQAMIDAMPSEGMEDRSQLVIMASRSLCDNYRATLRSGGQELAYLSMTDGTPQLSYQGIPIVEMGLWDSVIGADAASTAPAPQNTANDLDGHLAVLTVKNNIVVGTDYDSVSGADMWYNRDEKENRFRLEYVVGTNYKNDELTVTCDSNS